MKTEDKIKKVMGFVDDVIDKRESYFDHQITKKWDEYALSRERLGYKLRELLTPVELSDEDIKNIDDNTHFHEAPDWSVRFARNVLKAAGLQGEKE